MILKERKRHRYAWVRDDQYWNLQVGMTSRELDASTFASVAEAYDQRMTHAELRGVDVTGWDLYAVYTVETWEKVREPSSGAPEGH